VAGIQGETNRHVDREKDREKDKEKDKETETETEADRESTIPSVRMMWWSWSMSDLPSHSGWHTGRDK
jgi:hypothetical protein